MEDVIIRHCILTISDTIIQDNMLMKSMIKLGFKITKIIPLEMEGDFISQDKLIKLTDILLKSQKAKFNGTNGSDPKAKEWNSMPCSSEENNSLQSKLKPLSLDCGNFTSVVNNDMKPNLKSHKSEQQTNDVTSKIKILKTEDEKLKFKLHKKEDPVENNDMRPQFKLRKHEDLTENKDMSKAKSKIPEDLTENNDVWPNYRSYMKEGPLEKDDRNIKPRSHKLEDRLEILDLPKVKSESRKGNTLDASNLYYSYNGQYSKLNIFIHKADITKLEMDAIVNAANSELAHVGGVARRIAEVAGKELEDECASYIQQGNHVSVTEVFVSTGGKLPAKFVLHAVGPFWDAYEDKWKCEYDLRFTILRCLVEAIKLGISSIALPAISSNLFGVPQELCAKCYMEAIKHFDEYNAMISSTLEEIHFVDQSANMVEIMNHAFSVKWGLPCSCPVQDKIMDFKGVEKHLMSKKQIPARNGAELKKNHVKLDPEKKSPEATVTLLGQKRPSLATIQPLSRQGRSLQPTSQPLKSRKDQALEETRVTPAGQRHTTGSYLQGISKHYSSEEPCKTSKYKEKVYSFTHEATHGKCHLCRSEKKVNFMSCCQIRLCAECKLESLLCPKCLMASGKVFGNQPDGYMSVTKIEESAEGFEGVGAWEICYYFPQGFQQENHPSPGKLYKGSFRVAFLPATEEAYDVLLLLRVAFLRHLIFSIGTSLTRQVDGVIVWDQIPHKTRLCGGSAVYGYPDPSYLSLVMMALKMKAVEFETITRTEIEDLKEFESKLDKYGHFTEMPLSNEKTNNG